jgi:hypothetical protein
MSFNKNHSLQVDDRGSEENKSEKEIIKVEDSHENEKHICDFLN